MNPVATSREKASYGTLGLAAAIAVLGLGCLNKMADEDLPASARERPNDWGFESVPSTCDASSEDDVCGRCEKNACCAEIAACDADCRILYGAYHDCLYPGDGPWSGCGSAACKSRMLELVYWKPVTVRQATSALLDCFSTKCATDSTCGVEPRAVFAFPAPRPASDFSAAQFLESYCSGCHYQGFLGPTGNPTSALSNDAAWRAPFANDDWFASMSYDVALEKQEAITCGVRADKLSDGCSTLASVPPGFFVGPGKFPPSGLGAYGGAPNPCRFAPDGHTCPQPTAFERARLLSWIADGSPR